MPTKRTDSPDDEAAKSEIDISTGDLPKHESAIPADDTPPNEIPVPIDDPLPTAGPEIRPDPDAPPFPPREVDEPEDVALLNAVDESIRTSGPGRIEEPDRFEETYRSEEPDRPEEPILTSPAPAPVHQDPHVEESGPSFAGRALTALILLLAGGALGIWAAPKVAPMLPAGMEPVATWLTPVGTAAENRIAALESRLDADLGAVKSQVSDLTSGPELGSRISAAVTESEAKIDGEIATLRDQMGQIDGADTRQRLARVEAAVEGQVAQLDTLKSQIESSGVAGSSAGVDVYKAEVDGLRAEMGALSDKVGALAARIDEVSAEAKRQVETAQETVNQVQTEASTAVSGATLAAELAKVEAALEAGQPFAEPLDQLAADPALQIPEGLRAAAPTGISSMAQLRDSFGDSAHQAIRASITAEAEGQGVVARAEAFLRAQVATRSLTPQEGSGPDAVLSRMENLLSQDDLAGALAEADKLPTEAAAAMSGWLDAARLRANAEAGLATLTAELSATN